MNDRNTNKHPAGLTRGVLGLVAAVLIVGALLTWRTTIRVDQGLRQDFLQQTRLTATALDIERIKKLSGTTADLVNPEYIRIKEQFAALKNAMERCRFIYLMGRRPDGRVFFFVDNEPTGSPDESPAGQIYEEISPEYLLAFDRKEALIVGPVTDRWGEWITGLIPFIDPQTGDLIAVLGMDVDARDWSRSVVWASLPPAMLSLMLAAVVIIGSTLLSRRSRSAGPVKFWMRHLEAVSVLVAGLVLTLFAAWSGHKMESHIYLESFRSIAESKTAAFSESLRIIQTVEIEGLARFFEGSANVSLDEFNRYTGYLSRNQAVQAWEWIPVVTDVGKDAFEKAARAAGLTDFEIWQKDAAGNREPAARRDFYYPRFSCDAPGRQRESPRL